MIEVDMDRDGIKKSFLLLGSYWPNFKMPTDQADVDISVEAWLTLLGKVPNEDVFQEIARLSASGREFAPNVGQIYAAIKERRTKALPEGKSEDARAYEAYVEKFHSQGLPTLREYADQGHTTGEWILYLDVAGYWND
jgi:hypothetical protein